MLAKSQEYIARPKFINVGQMQVGIRDSFLNEQAKETCSFRITPTRFENVVVKIIEINFKSGISDSLFIYFYGPSGEVVRTELPLDKGKDFSLELIIANEMIFEFYGISNGQSFQVHQIGFSSLNESIEFISSAFELQDEDIPRFLDLRSV